MAMNDATADSLEEEIAELVPEPRWPAAVAVLAVGGVYFALPAELTFGPRWLFPTLVLTALIPTVISHRVGKTRLNVGLGSIVCAVLTAGLIVSLVLLIKALPEHRETPVELLRSAGSLWMTNVLVFAL